MHRATGSAESEEVEGRENDWIVEAEKLQRSRITIPASKRIRKISVGKHMLLIE